MHSWSTPLCVSACFFRLPFEVNFFSHISHLKISGSRNPSFISCNLSCARQLELYLKVFEHRWHL